ncbi:MAG: M23 family metallopeptidase [Chloroflexota bacterium]
MKPRVMARPLAAPQSRRREVGVLVAAVVLVVIVAMGVSGMLGGGPTPTPALNSAVAGLPSDRPTLSSAEPAETPEPSDEPTAVPTPPPTSTPTERPSESPSASPEPSPRTTPGSGGAPTSSAEFDLDAQSIPIGFPLRPDTRYRYRNNWHDVRDGLPDDYNHARLGKDGALVRLHDGIDIYAAHGEPLVAPFDGSVVAASSRWQPWEPDRYGRTVVIVSEELATEGYIALFAHVDRVWVEPGMQVTRGQVVGTVGRTGNADLESVRAHLHFELRAPFLIDWSPLGEDRAVDVFNPYPALVAADPKRT